MKESDLHEGRRGARFRRRERGALALILLFVALSSGCEQYDPDRLQEESPAMVGAAGANSAPDAVDSGASEVDGGGGAGGSGGAGGEAPEGCTINLDVWTRQACPLICAETCNGKDDDCDTKVDEEERDQGCAIDNAQAACVEGECVIVECDEGYRDCDEDADNGCEAADDDVNNCGSCGHVCELDHAIEACVGGECVASGCEPLYGDCDSDPNDCEAAVNTLDSCAVCGVSCSDVPNATASCALGFCGVGQCAEDFGDCNEAPGDGCEQSLDSVYDCGSCGTPCALEGSTSDCSTFVCLATACDDGYADCDSDATNGCESLASELNCGRCGANCDTALMHVESAACDEGACELGCAQGFLDCDGDTQTGCETETSPARCTACDEPCMIPNAFVSCETGECVFEGCRDGFGDCNGDLARDGCETSLDENDDNCGECGNRCTIGAPVCSGRRCTDVICEDPTTADCDENGSCETDLESAVAHCGGCGNACRFTTGTPNAAASPICDDGSCEPLCNALFGDCNSDYRDGCERSLRQLTNCGSCGMPCAIANATATCQSGSCEVAQCAPDWADCNDDSRSCETQLGTLANCTGCGQGCALANAVATCAGSAGSHSCGISACQPNFENCDNLPANGCEVDKRSSRRNCGACGNDCATHPHVASATCGNSACGYTCAAGYGNCTSALGCETQLNSNTDCGGCGVACSRANGSASCSSGSCELTGCEPGFDNCDGNAANGCEPLNSVQNCGGCGDPCLISNGTGSCETRSCEVADCNSGWEDCDSDPANGCEHNVLPPAQGGQGPCRPDPSCTRYVYDSRDYFFCTGELDWSSARGRCQQQLLGELAHVNDAAEDAFVRSHIVADSWLGGTDAVEGTWRWINDNTLFWMGVANGTGSGYTHFNSGEPNNTGNNEDCLEIYAAGGTWNDNICQSGRDYVCEVQADLCPSDPNKANPGQCGCGAPDTDGDNDGVANCNDACPTDPNKIEAGACGCGTADTDGDGDGTPNCADGCPADPGKIAAGQCGCGTADTDSDGDGTANCHDGCPADPDHTAPPCAFNYTPSNFDPNTLNFDSAPNSTLNCGTTTVDTSGSVTISNWCGTAPAPIVRTQTASGGPEVVILPLSGLNVSGGATLRVIGTRPVILAVRGDVNVSGAINARGMGGSTGAGGNQLCPATALGRNGGDDGGGDSGGGGGGGGAFGANGGNGGAGDRGGGGGAQGTSHGVAALAPLRGGCAGGRGGNGNGAGGAGGVAGGAVQITASGTVTITSGGNVSASGGGGLRGSSAEDGGGGGGSGGGVLIEAGTLSVQTGAWITANGGGGASGSSSSNSTSQPGTDGYPNQTARAPGGPGSNGGGNGGGGGAQAGAAQNGATGQPADCFLFLCTSGAGGGGGGGSPGRVRFRGALSCNLGGNVSPAATTACP